MNPVVLCMLVNGASICAPSLGGAIDLQKYELVQRIPCADCAGGGSVDIYRGKQACLQSVAGIVVASALTSEAPMQDDSQTNEFVDVTVRDRTLMFSLPKVRASRDLILWTLRRHCLSPVRTGGNGSAGTPR